MFLKIFIIQEIIIFVVLSGINYKHWQEAFPYIANKSRVSDGIISITLSLFGIVSLLALIFVYMIDEYKIYGWRLPFTKRKS